MKKCLQAIILKAMLYLSIASLSVFSQWQSIGLENHIVNSIIIDDQNRVIAGTDKGAYIYRDKDWLEISTLLPVQDMIVTGPARFVAALGGGSNSDGLYSADAINGAPYYKLSLIGYMDFPQSLGKTENSDVVFVGGPNRMAYSILDTANKVYMNLQPLKIPDFSFGIKDPRCAGIHVFSGDDRLYAGGFDMSPDSGPGHLLWKMKDTMAILKKINVSCLSEGFTELGGKLLYIGTRDSGIYYTSPVMSSPPVRFCTTPNNEAVHDMIALPSLIMSDILCIAVKSGVYLRSGNSWQEAGNIPEEPRCVVTAQDSSGIIGYVLYAGTAKGVYLYVSMTGPIYKHPIENATDNTIAYMQSSRTAVISFYLKKPGRVELDISDMAGRVVCTQQRDFFSAGHQILLWNMNTNNNKSQANGVYIIRLLKDGLRVHKKMILTQ